jgi:hypothetical protein
VIVSEDKIRIIGSNENIRSTFGPKGQPTPVVSTDAESVTIGMTFFFSAAKVLNRSASRLSAATCYPVARNTPHRPARFLSLLPGRSIGKSGKHHVSGTLGRNAKACVKLAMEKNRKNVELLAAARYARADPRNDMTSSAGETTRD